MAIAPEYAFGLPDFDAVDRSIRKWPSPLIFIAGFGAVEGRELTAWLGVAGPTSKEPGWNDGSGPAPNRTYNCGWAWVHRPGISTRCIAFLKNFPEARYEPVLLERFDTGRDICVLSADDLAIAPLICADLIARTNGAPLARIRSWIAASARGRPTLVTGSLLQREPAHELWQAAIGEAAQLGDRVNLALANISAHSPKASEAEDRWRSLSGVFTSRRSYTADQARLSPARNLGSHAALAGIMVRDTSPCGVLGPVRWEFGADHGRHLWRALEWWRIGDDGDVRQKDPICDRFAYELVRSARLRRFQERESMAEGALDELLAHVSSGRAPKAGRIIQTLIHGPQIEKAQVDPDTLREQATLAPALISLALLKRGGKLVWDEERGAVGQLRSPDGTAEQLVWYPPDSYPEDIEIELASLALRPGALRPLYVFAKSAFGQIERKRIVPSSRARVGQVVSVSGRRNVTAPERPRPIELVPSAYVEACATASADEDVEGIITGLLLPEIDEGAAR